MKTTWVLRQNPYGNKSFGTDQYSVEHFIKKTGLITAPYGHIDKEINNTQYKRFISKEIKQGDIILIPLKGHKRYIVCELTDNNVYDNYNTNWTFSSDSNKIILTENGLTLFRPCVRKVKNIYVLTANFDMRRFPKCTFCKVKGDIPI